MNEETDNGNGEASLVASIINLLKRIQSIEKRLIVVETILKITNPQIDNHAKARSKWEEWARKVLLKIVEWFIVVFTAILGVKLVSGI